MRSVLLLLFFLSGVSALVYQMAWARMLHLVFGVTSFAIATVLTAYMAGLALGSYLGGRFVEHRRRPLRAFGFLEIGIGLFALAFPFLTTAITSLYVAVYQRWEASLYVFSLLRFLLAFSVLMIPTTLMGATLPILAKSMVKKLARLGSDLGALYSANNVGAMLGALGATFFLIQALGVRESTYLAAAISIGVGIAAFCLREQPATALADKPAPSAPTRAPAPPAAAQPVPRYPRYVMHVALWVFAIEGFTTLAYEVLWTRMLSGSTIVATVHAFGLVVATFIAGLALGSFLIGKIIDRRVDLIALLGGIEIAIGVIAVLLLPLFSRTPERVAQLLDHAGSWEMWTVARAVWLAALMLVPATLMGATFPIVGRIYTTSLAQLGRRIGKVGCLDTIGSIFGAFAGGFILIPLLGMQQGGLLVAMVNLAIGLAALAVHPAMRRAWKGVAAGAVVAFALLAYAVIPQAAIFVPRQFTVPSESEVVYYSEGVDATVSVCQWANGPKMVAVNGVDVAGNHDRATVTSQVMQAHLPLLLYEATHKRPPRSALQVGLGSGHSCKVMTEHPGMKTIHCVELNPGVKAAAQAEFAELNDGLFTDPRFRVIIQDARNYVLATDRKYDLIMNDSIHPGIAGNASLYTREHFLNCRSKLTEDGMMSVWMPVYHLSSTDLKMIFKSFRQAFPYATFWYVPNGANRHAILIGFQKPLQINYAKFRKAALAPSVQRNLKLVDAADPNSLLACMLLDVESLRRYCEAAPMHTDDHPYLEYSAGKTFWQNSQRTVVARMFELLQYRASVLPYLTHAGSTEQEIADARRNIANAFEVAGLLTRGFMWYSLTTPDGWSKARGPADSAQALAPADPNTQLLVARCDYADAYIDASAGRYGPALLRCQQIIQRKLQFIEPFYLMGEVYERTGSLDLATAILERGLAKSPYHITSRLLLAKLYLKARQPDRAAEAFGQIMTLWPKKDMLVRAVREKARQRQWTRVEMLDALKILKGL